jgi:hypothetical protein
MYGYGAIASAPWTYQVPSYGYPYPYPYGR